MRTVALALLLAVLTLSAAPAKKRAQPKPEPLAPDAVPHQVALFLRTITNDGGRTVTLKATAVATRFYIEEPTGVTVYRFEKGHYAKEEFLRDSNLVKAVKRYAAK
ncbi:MAG TPA: hypothetical protein VEK11_11860 [Thermoanaerobaculia bacterium]|jgi:hypothetical protein|nr:hypothetical protein [Thermoanaerobaculia bacterium]